MSAAFHWKLLKKKDRKTGKVCITASEQTAGNATQRCRHGALIKLLFTEVISRGLQRTLVRLFHNNQREEKSTEDQQGVCIHVDDVCMFVVQFLTHYCRQKGQTWNRSSMFVNRTFKHITYLTSFPSSNKKPSRLYFFVVREHVVHFNSYTSCDVMVEQ